MTAPHLQIASIATAAPCSRRSAGVAVDDGRLRDPEAPLEELAPLHEGSRS
jgi:hypothetical protein